MTKQYVICDWNMDTLHNGADKKELVFESHEDAEVYLYSVFDEDQIEDQELEITIK